MRYYTSYNVLLVATIFSSEVVRTSPFTFVTRSNPVATKTKLHETDPITQVRPFRKQLAVKRKINHNVPPLKYKKADDDTTKPNTEEVESIVSSLLSDVYIENTKASTTSASAPTINLPTPQPLPGDCDVKSYIQEHAKFYDGDATFLKGPTPRTKKALDKFNQLLTKEREAGGVLSVDAETPSTITSHEPGYLLSKEEDIIVGLQADEPLKRTCKPHGG